MKNTCYRLRAKARVFSLLSTLCCMMLLPVFATAQSQTSPTDGMRVNTPNVHAFTNATIVTEPGRSLENATLVIRNGVIEAVGRNARIPADARIWDMEGKTIYPGFIDAHSEAGMQEPRVELDRGSQSWNPQLRAHLLADQEYKAEDDGSSALRSQGFAAVMSVPTLGIFRGQTAVISLHDGSVTDRVIRSRVAQSVSLTRSNQFGFSYPTSPIGAIALIRQTLYDADWYKNAHSVYSADPSGLQRPENNAMLAALNDVVGGTQPLLFETRTDEEILRAMRFTNEFSITPWIRGNGHEYRILDVLSGSDIPLILPVNFPDKPDVESPEDALNRDLASLRHWYLAPENPARLANAGVRFALTTDGLDSTGDFLSNLRKAVELGLSKDDALAALTTTPAGLLGIDNTHGTLSSGKSASFIVASGDVFENGNRIIDMWVDGHHYSINREDAIDPRGEWEIASANGQIDGVIEIKRQGNRLSGAITINDSEIELKSAAFHDESRRIRADFDGSDLNINGIVRITATISGEQLYGWAEIGEGERIQWSGSRVSTAEESEPRERSLPSRDLELAELRPNMEFGREALPEQPRRLMVRNATIWTMGPDGILENADLYIEEGRVVEVGQDLRSRRNMVEIDATGKHVTPGLIDAHLHSGVTGVNEIGNAITAEVRMGDVLNINNIWMYRQLAGGLTTAHVMHGSANAIGGQNVFVKMRWGALSDDIMLEGAPRTIKFALGENPKRVGSNRYPDTRMGVEQIIADRFRMARDYEARWAAWERTGEGIPPRRDLRLDALVDILNGEILVQSHSYRQDEILMLMRLAEEFDFTVKAFHHGVEAYKVASELAEHGAGAVVWSDWSSFKIEAYDATVYNARLLHEAGVVTSLHSDNSQIATRMNWEAAKMVRAGVDPEVAMSMITSATAQLLGIDDRVGSLESGKDADFVIWSGDPLSTFTIAEQTWVDGRKYFDLKEDAMLRRNVEAERAALIQRILED